MVEPFHRAPSGRVACWVLIPCDEPMAPQNIPTENSCVVSNMIARNSLKSFGLQFEVVPFDEKCINMNEGKISSAGLSSNIFLLVQHC